MLIEKAEEAASEEDQAAMGARMLASISFGDLVKQLPDAAQDGPTQGVRCLLNGDVGHLGEVLGRLADDFDDLHDLCEALSSRLGIADAAIRN
jgi:hypothetical protein